MKKLLWRKMLRDMKRSWTTYLLCVLIVAIGFWGYSVLELCYENLMTARDTFFDQSDFCDGFAKVQDGTVSVTNILEHIDGVEKAEGRLVKDVQVSSFQDTDAELHLVSWADGQMNRPVLSAGEMPGNGKLELVIGEGMAKARNLRPGDKIRLNAGKWNVEMEITGIGLTPENIYMIRDMSDLFPSPADYDAAFISYQTMEHLLGLTGRANSFLIRLEPGREWEQIEEELRQRLEPYGLQTYYEKENQLGVQMVGEEMKQLDRMSGVIPFLFLLAAGVMLYISLGRMVEQQRTQVGTLLALGISTRVVCVHYMLYGAVTGGAGGLLGGILGYFSAGSMVDFYRMYFNLPKVNAPLNVVYFLTGTAAGAAFCGATAWLVARRLGELNPAEGLRPAAPRAAGYFFLEKIPGFRNLFTVPGLMAIRSLARNRRRAAISLCGMAFAYMITATLVSMNSMFDLFIFDYWEETQRQDIMVYLDRPVKNGEISEAVRHPGLQRAEGVMEFPVTLKGPEGRVDCRIQAIESDSELCRLYREDGKRAMAEDDGIILSVHMAEVLGVKKGDIIETEVFYPELRQSRVVVSDVIAQYMGSSAYMSQEGAGKISDYRNVSNLLLLKGSGEAMEAVRKRFDQAEGIVIQSRQERVDQYRSMMGSMGAMMASMASLGVLISFAVIYISSLISFEELKREISTLMMLGVPGKECLDVISTSQWLLAAGAALVGIPMSMGASWLISTGMASDLYSIPSFIDGKSLLQAIGLTGAAVALSSWMMLRKIRKIVPVELLRDRE